MPDCRRLLWQEARLPASAQPRTLPAPPGAELASVPPRRESSYEEVKGQWEERFEVRCGRWRGTVEQAVDAFLDCGVYERGLARVPCGRCRAEYLVAFSCQRRGLCPSCAAKRGALFGTRLLRPYFLHHRRLLGGLCRAGWEVVRELMVTATGDRHLQPGMMSVIQTSGDLLGWHPHVHALASRGGWNGAGRWVPVSFVAATVAERLFRHQVIALLPDEGLLSPEHSSHQPPRFSPPLACRRNPPATLLEPTARLVAVVAR